jgi:hypothetical protein
MCHLLDGAISLADCVRCKTRFDRRAGGGGFRFALANMNAIDPRPIIVNTGAVVV